MRNAKSEFLNHINGFKVKCAVVEFFDLKVEPEHTVYAELGCAYTQEEYDRFLEEIDREYNDGYGSQELYGTIWYEDGTWSERGEYDGSEWWSHVFHPEIPESLKRPDLVRDSKIEKILK